MALRVARGLFRLWLILSVLWIGGVSVVTWLTVPEVATWLTFDNSIGMFDDLIAKAAIQRGVKIALIPPVLVLALGSALVWAFRGFR
jgi:hypothetical protein